MKKHNGIIWLVIVTAFAVLAGTVVFTHSDYATSNASEQNKIVASVAIMNKDLPKMVGKHTRLNSVSISNKHYIYHFTLVEVSTARITDKNKLQELKSTLKTTLSEEAKKSVCGDKDVKEIVDTIGGVSYIYSDKDSLAFLRIDIEKSDCDR